MLFCSLCCFWDFVGTDLDTLQVMPVEVRRYTGLIRDLDSKCMEEQTQLKEMQKRLLSRMQETVKGAASPEEREKLVDTLRAGEEFQRIEKLRESLKQKIAEKMSIAEQLYDVSELNLKRLNSDILHLSDILEIPQHGSDVTFEKGRDVAALIETETGRIWILAKVVDYYHSDPHRVLLVDADNPNDSFSKFALHTSRVRNLPQSETLEDAKGRLAGRGKKIYAMYPDTTSFYRGSLVSFPQRDTSANGNERIVCGVQFDDDADAVTGVTPKHLIESRRCFVV